MKKATKRLRATVVRIYPRGYGFLLDEQNVERFFHATACDGGFDQMESGDDVTFEPGTGSKGPVAYKVEKEGD